MKLRVKVLKVLPRHIGDGDDERVMVRHGMNPAGLRQGGGAVAARKRQAGEEGR